MSAPVEAFDLRPGDVVAEVRLPNNERMRSLGTWRIERIESTGHVSVGGVVTSITVRCDETERIRTLPTRARFVVRRGT